MDITVTLQRENQLKHAWIEQDEENCWALKRKPQGLKPGGRIYFVWQDQVVALGTVTRLKPIEMDADGIFMDEGEEAESVNGYPDGARFLIFFNGVIPGPGTEHHHKNFERHCCLEELHD